jgi:N-carbamoyl-L-amino-acid hydrolase
MQIQLDRLQHSVLTLAQIGATPEGGVSRLALSDADKEGRDLLVRWMRATGLEVTIDTMGNIFGRRHGTDQDAAILLIGSHIDSVKEGGKFDGALGVLSALEVVRTLNDQQRQTRHPIEVVAFTNEEGVRFPPAMLASGVMAGHFTLDYAYSRTDTQGKRFGEELARIGYRGSRPCTPRHFHAYIEMHVEQGPVLITEGYPIGVVEGVLGISWSTITILGERDHAGPTPMAMRHDALVAAAQIVLAVRNLATTFGGDMVTTVGTLDVEPNMINVIPGRVVLSVNIRDWYDEKIRQALTMLKEEAARIAKTEGVHIEVDNYWHIAPTHFSPEIVAAVERSCQKRGCQYRKIVSGAGHDANYLNHVTRTGMIFVPSIGGKSHCPEENTAWEDIEKGANVLLQTVLDLAEA